MSGPGPMRAFERVWWMSVGAIVAFLFILFAIYNGTPVVVDVYVKRYVVEVWVVVLLSFVAGLLVPVAFILAQRLLAARRERALRREVATLKGELDALRNAALVEPLVGERPAAGAAASGGALAATGGAGGAAGDRPALPPAAGAARPPGTEGPKAPPVPTDVDGDLAGA